MRVRLNIDVFSPAGARLARELENHVDAMSYHCACREGDSCDVIVEEASDQRYDVFVTRSGYSLPPPDDPWTVVGSQDRYRYISSFRSPSAETLALAIERLIAIPYTLSR